MLRGVQEQRGHGDSAEVVEQEGQTAVYEADHEHGAQTLPDAVGTSGAEVLAAVGGHSHARGVQRRGDEAVDLAAGGDRGDRIGPEAVDGALHQDRADGRDGKLQAHRQTDRRELRDVFQIRPQIAAAEVQRGHAAADIHMAGRAGGQLRDHRGQGRALDAHAEHAHQEQVEQDVDDHGHDQEVHRGVAVAHGAQHGGAEVIQHRRAHAHEHDVEVAEGLVEDLGRGVDQTQDVVGPEGAQQHDERRQPQAQPDELARAALHAHGVSRAEALGHGDGQTRAAADGKAQDHKVQRAGSAHRGESVHAEDAADQDAVGQTVKLLKQVAQKQQPTEGQDASQGRTRRHISCCRHSGFLLSKVGNRDRQRGTAPDF